MNQDYEFRFVRNGVALRATIDACSWIWWARLDTPNFRFDTFGYSEAHARQLLREGWARHAKQTGATDPWSAVKGDVQVTRAALGGCLRDGEAI